MFVVDGGDGFEDNSDDDEPIMKNNYVLDDFIAFNVDPQVTKQKNRPQYVCSCYIGFKNVKLIV